MSTLLSLMLVGLSLGQTPQTVQPFPDVPKTHWAYAAVTELHERGILKGYPSEYDRSTPQAALQSLIKAIRKGDEVMMEELMASDWRERLKKGQPDAVKRLALLRQYSQLWEARDMVNIYNPNEPKYNVEARRAVLGNEVRFNDRRYDYDFVLEPAGWKVVRVSHRW